MQILKSAEIKAFTQILKSAGIKAFVQILKSAGIKVFAHFFKKVLRLKTLLKKNLGTEKNECKHPRYAGRRFGFWPPYQYFFRYR